MSPPGTLEKGSSGGCGGGRRCALGASAGATTAAGQQVDTPVRSAFETAPLFSPTLKVGITGNVHVDWKLPDNVGTFVIRAYAVSTTNRFGVSSDVKQIARNAVSLIASVSVRQHTGTWYHCAWLRVLQYSMLSMCLVDVPGRWRRWC